MRQLLITALCGLALTALAGQRGAFDEGHFSQAPVASASYALAFDGTQNYVAVADSENIYATVPITIEGWITVDDLTKPWTGMFETCMGADFYTWNRGLMVVGGLTNMSWWWMTSANQAAFVSDTYGAFTQTNVWFHLAFQYDGANGSVYINGEAVGALAVSASITPDVPKRFSFAYPSDSLEGEGYFCGKLSETRISDKVRYTSNFTPTHGWANDTNTIALWLFQSGSGGSVVDSSGNGRDLILYGDPLPAWVAR